MWVVPAREKTVLMPFSFNTRETICPPASRALGPGHVMAGDPILKRFDLADEGYHRDDEPQK